MERKYSGSGEKKVSVVIPCYNREKTVLRAIKSALDKNVFEVIVVDDGSSDASLKKIKTIKDSRVKCFALKKNQGVNAARNKGIKESSGDFILFLDSDDELINDWFNIIKNYFDNVITFFCSQTISGKSMSVVSSPGKKSYKQWLGKIGFSGEFLPLVKKNVFDKDMFDDDRFCFESFFWNRIIKKHGVFVSDEVVRIYHVDSGNQVSDELINVKNAKRRFLDYKKYLSIFEKDYVTFGLSKSLAKHYSRLGIYGAVAGKKEWRSYIKKAYSLDSRFLSVYLVSFFGKNVFRVYMKLHYSFIKLMS